jgi:hypothetical protein
MQSFFDSLSGPHGGNVGVVLSFLIAGLTAAMYWGFANWRRIEQARIEAALKQEMLLRGMSADDIVRVIEASQIKSNPASCANDTAGAPATSE